MGLTIGLSQIPVACMKSQAGTVLQLLHDSCLEVFATRFSQGLVVQAFHAAGYRDSSRCRHWSENYVSGFMGISEVSLHSHPERRKTAFSGVPVSFTKTFRSLRNLRFCLM